MKPSRALQTFRVTAILAQYFTQKKSILNDTKTNE